MNKKLVVCLLVVFSLLIVGNVSAQDVVPQDNGVLGIERDVFIGICIAVAILFQGVVIAYVNKNPKLLYESYIKLLDDRSVRNAAEHTYMSSSLPVQEFIKILKSGVLVVSQLDIEVVDDYVDPLAEFLDDVTDDLLGTSEEDSMG